MNVLVKIIVHIKYCHIPPPHPKSMSTIGLRMVNTIWACHPNHMFVWHSFLKSHLTTYHSNKVVWFTKMTDLGTSTFQEHAQSTMTFTISVCMALCRLLLQVWQPRGQSHPASVSFARPASPTLGMDFAKALVSSINSSITYLETYYLPTKWI